MANNRIDLLKRRNAGKALRQEWEKRLFGRFGLDRESVAFCDLENSDNIRERAQCMFGPRHENPGEVFSESRISREKAAKMELLPSSDIQIYIILLDADKTGVIRMPIETLNRIWIQLLESEPDGFSVVDANCKNKVVIQVVDDRIDMAAWGPEWSGRVPHENG